MSSEVIKFLGWMGVLCCTSGYLLISINHDYSNRWQHQILNAFGGIFLLTSALYNHDTPNTVANAVWAVIGIISLSRIVFRLRVKRTSH